MEWRIAGEHSFDNKFDPRRMSKKIKSLMEVNGYTDKKLAERIGVTEQCVNNWRHGSRLPDYYNLYELGKIFDVSMDELFGMTKRNVVIEYEIFNN